MSTILNDQYELKRYLPPYRNLLNPGKIYDYINHTYVDSSTLIPTPITKPKKSQDHYSTKPKYKSLISILDAASLKSNKSISNKSIAKNVRPKDILELPDEILLLIFNNLLNDQKTLVHLLYVNKKFSSVAKEVLYSTPYFTSTFRVAQFVHTLNYRPELSLKVKRLDFSNLRIGIDLDENDSRQVEDFNSNEFLAGWRDYKYRDHPLYGLRRPLVYQLISPQISNCSTNNERTARQSSTTSMNSLFSTSNGSNDSMSPIRSRSRSTSSPEPTKSINKSSSLTNKIKKVFNNKHDQNSLSNGFNGPEMSELFQSFESAQHKKRNHSQRRKIGTSHELQINSKQEQEQERLKRKQKLMNIPLSKRRPFTSSHPIQNRFLNQYSFSKDLPVGFILHLLDDCKNLESIDFSGLSLSTDFEFQDFQYFDWEISKGKLHSPAHLSSDSSYGSLLLDVGTKEEQRLREQEKLEKYKVNKSVYWSDTTREVDYYNSKIPKVNVDKIWNSLIQLENLKSIKLCSLVWLKQVNIETFLNNSLSLKNNNLKIVDCTDSGMIKGAGWARSRTTREWRFFFRKESNLRSRRRF